MDPGTLYLLANLHQLKNSHVNFDEIIKRNLLSQNVPHSHGGIRSVLVPVPKSCDLKFSSPKRSPKRRCSETKQRQTNQHQKVGKAAPGQFGSEDQSMGQKPLLHTDVHNWHGYSSWEESEKYQSCKIPSRQASSTQFMYSEQGRNVEQFMKDEARPQELYTSNQTQGRPFHDSPHEFRHPVDVNPNMQQSLKQINPQHNHDIKYPVDVKTNLKQNLKQIDPHQNYKMIAQDERYKTVMAGSGRETDFKSNCSKHFLPEYTGDNNEIINLSKNRNTVVSVPETQGFVTEVRHNQGDNIQKFFDKYQSPNSSNYRSQSSGNYGSQTSTSDQSQTSKHSVDNQYPTAFQQKPRNCSLKEAAVTGFSLKSHDPPHVHIPQHERPVCPSYRVISTTSGFHMNIHKSAALGGDFHSNIHKSAALDDRTLKDRLNAPSYDKYTQGTSVKSGNVKTIPDTIKDKSTFKDDYTQLFLNNDDNRELFHKKSCDFKDDFKQPFLKDHDNRKLFHKKSSDFKDDFTQPFLKNDYNGEIFRQKSSDMHFGKDKYMEETPLRSDNTCLRVPGFTSNSGCEVVIKQEVEEDSSRNNQVVMPVAKNRKLVTDVSEMEDTIAILMKAQTSFHKPPYTKVKEELMEKHRVNIESHLREPKTGPERDSLVNKWLSEFVEASVVTMIKFAKGIPGFKELNLQDQAQLLKGSKSESLMSGGMVIIDYEYELLTMQDGHHFMFEDLIKVFSQKFFVKKLESLIMVEALRFSERETAIVRAMTIVNPDRCALEERSKVEVIYNKLLDCLQYEIDAHYLHVDARLRQILDLLQDMKEISELQMPSLQSALESKGVLAARPLLAEYMSS